jgi:hypothetical protein
MNRKNKRQDVSATTTFVCRAVEANDVFLAGTFNNWNPVANPMQRTQKEGWQIDLQLAPGRYEYKFVVDGKWCCEPGRDDIAGCPKCVRNDRGIQCATCVPNAFGTMNRVIEVGAGRGAAASSGRAA